MARHVMTARRRAALRKAQLASARKRRNSAKATYKKRKQTARSTYKSTKAKANARRNRAIRSSHTRNLVSGYNELKFHAAHAQERGGWAGAIGQSVSNYADNSYAVPLGRFDQAVHRANSNYGSTVKSAKRTYKSAKRSAKSAKKRR